MLTAVEGPFIMGTARASYEPFSFDLQYDEPKAFKLRRFPDRMFCGAISDGDGHRFLKEVNVGQGGGLKDVVVVVEGVQRGRPLNHLLRRCLPCVTMVGVLVCGQPHRGHQQAAGQRDSLQYQRNTGTLQLTSRLNKKRSHDTASSDMPAIIGGLFEWLEHNARSNRPIHDLLFPC